MARYGREYRGRWARDRTGDRAPTGWPGYREAEFRGRARRRAGDYGRPFREPGRGWLPGKPAHGFPVRGVHTYDLDYGTVAGGPTTDYSGRAGYDVPREAGGPGPGPRGPYTPWLEETGGRGLYGREYPAYPPRRWRRGPRPRP